MSQLQSVEYSVYLNSHECFKIYIACHMPKYGHRAENGNGVFHCAYFCSSLVLSTRLKSTSAVESLESGLVNNRKLKPNRVGQVVMFMLRKGFWTDFSYSLHDFNKYLSGQIVSTAVESSLHWVMKIPVALHLPSDVMATPALRKEVEETTISDSVTLLSSGKLFHARC
jgi:hypothetical protein